MISSLREEVHAEIKLLREEMIERRSNTTKVIDHLSVFSDYSESATPSTVVANEIAQLRNDFNIK